MNLASIMKDVVIQRLCERIKKTRYIFIIADSTQDHSKTEMTVLFTCHIKDLDRDITSASYLHFPVVVKRLIGIFTSKGTTGKESYRKIIDILRMKNLDVSKTISQSYVGAWYT